MGTSIFGSDRTPPLVLAPSLLPLDDPIEVGDKHQYAVEARVDRAKSEAVEGEPRVRERNLVLASWGSMGVSGKCFECNEPGHIAKDCPKLKEKYMKYKKKKAMYAGWEESEPSDSDSDEEGAKLALHNPNVCFMANEDEVISEAESESFYMQCDIAMALEELNFEFKRMSKEYSSFKNLHASCDIKLEQLTTSLALKDELLGDLDFENKQLRSKIKRLEIEGFRTRPTHAYANYNHHGRNRIKDNHDFYGLIWVPKGTKTTNHQGPKTWGTSRQRRKEMWYLDSGCSHHMTGNKELFATLSRIEGGNVSFGGGEKVNQDVKCLAAIDENPWIWHKRLGHANMELISKLSKKNLVKGLPSLHFIKDTICEDCAKDHHDKFDSKIDVGIFLGYAPRSKAYRVFNKRSLVVEESINVTFDETNIGSQVVLPRKDDDDDIEGGLDLLQINDTPSIEVQKDVDSTNAQEQVEPPKAWKFTSNHPKEQIIGSPSKGVITRSKALSECDVLLHGKKWAIFEKRSTTTKMESCFLIVLGSPNTKSILTSCQGRSGTGRGVYRPVFCLRCFANWQVRHCPINFATSLLRLGQ
uniref:Zinc knuckle family protein n=1 Tax=Asparagus officinalis TaxID=4686 RepID=Q2A9Z4_ASPOF|nr:Zinc knuckle family protein [Asparagus officinalis]